MKKYPTYNQLNLSQISKDILNYWKEKDTFSKSISTREGKTPWVFYEGPPSANGMPGIHHVMARTIKDIFCRYKTLQGFQVKRKAGWDTHGLPIELGVEKSLGITKEDIGNPNSKKFISVEDYNKACRKEVMKYTDKWEDVTAKMGYWVDMKDPYITYDNKYIESVWWLLQNLAKKDLLYKGYTIQPYSPAAGTGLSSHELNQPGCYRDVKDRTATVQFKVGSQQLADLKVKLPTLHLHTADLFFLAWTTTPWTLPSNTALAVGKDIDYVFVESFNPFSGEQQTFILAKDLLNKYFSEKHTDLKFEDYKPGDKNIPFKLVGHCKGSDLAGISYEQLLPFVQPMDGDAFKVIVGDFVTTTDGTGIVHIAPSFGADDFRVAKQNGIGSLTLVDKRGRFLPEIKDGTFLYGEEYVKEASTAMKDRMIELNKTINWKPEATGTGRFGNWLENLNDWNLSRSRFWGIPIPIWTSEDSSEQLVIGSAEELKKEIENSISKGFMTENPLGKFVPGNFTAENYDTFDLHKPYADNIVLEKNGKKLFREPDLIDVWFDSGAMPYAQVHYPFENKELIDDKKYYPADFIAEGVDQTRGWFFTLHAIATMNFDSVAYKNVVSNGLVLDKNGNKMSKRLGNAIDPFETIEKYGADATRWYMIANAAPWDNLKFDVEGIGEVQRKLFGTLYNTYGFFALYANVDNFVVDLSNTVNVSKRSELDRWILSKLNSLVKDVTEQYETFEPHKAARYIEEFVDEHLSNWYIRLSRRRFWKGDMSDDKKAAYETLFECLNTLSQLMSPIAPFFADWLYQNLNDSTDTIDSVHLSNYPKVNEVLIDLALEKRMEMAQKISSMILSIRKKENLRVRQPLQKIRIPILDTEFRQHVEAVKDIILAEVNVKELEFVTEEEAHIVKNLKLNFKTLGKKCGKHMKTVQAYANDHGALIISAIEKTGQFKMNVEGEEILLELEDVEIIPVDIPGWKVANSGQITVALDITLTDSLKEEGLARELVNRIQNLRKDSGLDVTDKILVKIQQNDALDTAIQNNLSYICAETLTGDLQVVKNLSSTTANSVEVDELVSTLISIEKLN
ncbi:MAG: isoleucine--tRNA ligase [Bacteroidetes bacterium]|nr:isoleucine--tRNA ligase [Bacteroidota bacterium]